MTDPDARPDELISADAIAQRVRQMGAAIAADYAGRDLVLVGVLRGAVPFLADLTRAIDLPHTYDMIGASSYGHTTRSSGQVVVTRDVTTELRARDVLLVEDIYDTGATMEVLLERLRLREPASLEICSLLIKDRPRPRPLAVRYCGFHVPDLFVVGYGLDYAGRYRHLPYIGLLAS